MITETLDLNFVGIRAEQLAHTQRRVQPDQCYFTIQITDINFECSL